MLTEFPLFSIIFLRYSTKKRGLMMKACFIGHKNIEKTEELIVSLKKTVATLIKKGVTTFLFGSRSEFNDLSWEVVTEIKREHPSIKRVYVRAAYQYTTKEYEEYLLATYEETYFPPKIENAGKYSYVERNCEMIDSSLYCVFYYNENYIASRRNSGTKIAYKYAVKKKKEIINLYKNPKDF